MRFLIFPLLTLIFLSAALTPLNADAVKGKKVFNKCKACHLLNKKKNRIGPHLVNIFGRKAGSVKNFRYSRAMKKSGIIWNKKTLSDYLEKPRSFIKGNRMPFAGLPKKSDRDNLIMFLEKATKP